MLRILTHSLFGAAALGAATLAAQTTPAATVAAAGSPEAIAAALAASPLWQHTETVRASIGWRDNILLSPFAPLSRPFGRGEIEAFVWCPARHGWEFLSFLDGDVVRYFSPPRETGGDQQWSAHVEERWAPAHWVRFTAKATGYLADTVLDLSESENTRIIAPTRVHGGFADGLVRLTLPGGFVFEPALQVKRTQYRVYPDDSDEVKSGGRLEWRRTDALALSAAWFEHRRNYSSRTQYTAGGRELAGTHLRFIQHEGEFKASTTWQLGGKWTAAATVGRLENRDNGSGYFDYNQKRARLDLDWRRKTWRVHVEGDAKRMDYRIQTVGTGITPPPRIADSFEVNTRIERELSDAWTVFAEHDWQRSRSNEIEFDYRANTVLAGVQRSF
jgi:hypothetical protein